jgi:hypothetical protein
MANHVSACESSTQLCDRLFNELNKKISHLVQEKGENKCSFKSTGIIFAWVNCHYVRIGRLNIWFLGDVEKAKKFSKLNVHPRGNPQNAGGWLPFEGSFDINNDEQLAEAVDLLFTISYPASLR